MDKQAETTRGIRPGSVLLGGLLILLGVVFLFGEMLNIRIGHFVWPLFVIGPGLLLFLLAFAFDDAPGPALASIGGALSMTGLLLFYQNVSGHWESWAYAWALVAPTSVGLGLLSYGWLKQKADLRQSGWNMVKVGLGIFVVAAVFFELVIGLGGFGWGRFGWPVLIIALGLFLLLRNVTAGWRLAGPDKADISDTSSEEENHVYDNT